MKCSTCNQEIEDGEKAVYVSMVGLVHEREDCYLSAISNWLETSVQEGIA